MSILVVDPVYNPNSVTTITSLTKLESPGITIQSSLEAMVIELHLIMLVKRKIEKNCKTTISSTEMMEMINGNIDLFNKVRLVVSEGIYKES